MDNLTGLHTKYTEIAQAIYDSRSADSSTWAEVMNQLVTEVRKTTLIQAAITIEGASQYDHEWPNPLDYGTCFDFMVDAVSEWLTHRARKKN